MLSKKTLETIVSPLQDIGVPLREHDGTPRAIKTWYAALCDLTEEELRRGVIHVLRHSTYPPRPGDVRKAAGRDPETEARRAWSLVLLATSRSGRRASVDFGPVANAALRAAGGWQRLCSADARAVPQLEASFVRHHQRLAAEGVKGRAASPLIGLDDGASGKTRVHQYLPGGELLELAGRHQEALEAGEVTDRQVREAKAKALPPGRLKELVGGLVGKLGQVKKEGREG